MDGLKVGRDEVVTLIVSSYDLESTPTPADVRANVDGLLTSPLLASLRVDTDYIVSEVLKRIDVRIGEASVLSSGRDHQEWLLDADRSEWRLWTRLGIYLEKSVKLPPHVLGELERSTDRTLEQLENPKREGAWDRRGMVVGHVQSGKTTHYTALACKALDAGYRAVIIIAGIHDNLRSQTQLRVDQCVIGKDTRRLEGSSAGVRLTGAAKYADEQGLEGPTQRPHYTVTHCTTAEEDGDFNANLAQQLWFDLSEHNRLVMVVKKNAGILRRMTKWLHHLLATGPSHNTGIDHPTLVIDDEADQASVNTGKSITPTSINTLIRELVSSLKRVGYVGYTATPFANIFIDAAAEHENPKIGWDLFPRDFIVNLKAPSNYVGPEVVFGHDGDESVGVPERPPLPMFVEVNDTDPWLPPKHKKDRFPGAVPPSLLEAIRLFVCVCATRRVRGHRNCHNSMLVHATRFTAVQNRVAQQIVDALNAIRNILSHGSPSDRQELENLLRATWNERIVAVHQGFSDALGNRCLPLPNWKEVREQLVQAVETIKVLEINGKSEESLAYLSHPNGLSVIAIGGDKLSRGLTLEDLSVSYFLRASNAFDTLMQMGRWFGYRPGYLDLCRVYTTKALYNSFREISLATEELRNDLDRMAAVNRKPSDFGLRVRRPSPKLVITAANKMKFGQIVTLQFAGEIAQALEIPSEGSDAENNRVALSDLIRSLSAPSHPKRASVRAHHVWSGVSTAKVLTFLESFTAYRDSSFLPTALRKCDPLCKYITEQEAVGHLTSWTVCLVSKEKGHVLQVDVGGLSVPLLHRKKADSASGRFRTNSLAGRAEEAVDLDDTEYGDAIALTKKIQGPMAANITEPAREPVRAIRPSKRGLLLLYPLLPKPPAKQSEPPADPDYQIANFVVSAAVSFPESSVGGSTPYLVNTVWMQEFSYITEDDDVDP